MVADLFSLARAALVYSGRQGSDYDAFVDGAALDKLAVFIGAKARQGPRKLSWDVYCELQSRVADGRLKPVKTSYLSNGRIDPRQTLIRAADLMKLARERGDGPAEAEVRGAQKKPLPKALDDDLKAFLLVRAHRNEDVAKSDAEQHFSASIPRDRIRAFRKEQGLVGAKGRPRKSAAK